MEERKDPVNCGWSIGFDSVYVCRLGLLPCARMPACPLCVMQGEGNQSDGQGDGQA